MVASLKKQIVFSARFNKNISNRTNILQNKCNAFLKLILLFIGAGLLNISIQAHATPKISASNNSLNTSVLPSIGSITGPSAVANNNGASFNYSVNPNPALKTATGETANWVLDKLNVANIVVSSNSLNANITFVSGFTGLVTLKCYRQDDNGNTSASTILYIIVEPPLVAPVLKQFSQPIFYNTSTNLTVSQSATGGDGNNYTYQWQALINNSWSNVGSPISTNLLPSPLPVGPLNNSQINSYRLNVVCDAVSINSNIVTVNVYPQYVRPAITPATQQVFYNDRATISASSFASGGTGQLTYQWQTLNNSNNWVNVNSSFKNPQTLPVLVTDPLTATSNSFRLYVTDDGNLNAPPLISNTAIVNVYPQFTNPTITPVTQQIFNNNKATISASSFATGGTGRFTYQWQILNSNNTWDNSGLPIDEPTTLPVLTTNPLTALTNSFRLVATDKGQINGIPAPLTSNTATVNVYPPYGLPAITPAIQQVFYNDRATISASSFASGGTGKLTYQWQTLNNSNNWVNVNSSFKNPQTLPVLVTDPLTATSNSFRLYVTDDGNLNAPPLISNTAIVNVYPQFTNPTITPVTQQIFNNNAATISASSFATGGTGSFTYQWQMLNNSNGWVPIRNPIVNPNTLPVLITDPLTAQTNSFRLVATDNGQANPPTPLVSNTATVNVYPPYGLPAIVPVNQQIFSNNSATISASSFATGGTGRFTYQWQTLNSSNTWDNSGPLIDEPTTLPVLNTIPLTALSNTFRLVAKDKGQVNDLPLISNTAIVTVYAPITPPTIIPITQQIFYNKSATISASNFATGGDGNFTYQWQILNSSNNWDNVGDPIDRPSNLPVLTQNNLTALSYSFRLSVIDKGQVNGTTLYSNTAIVNVWRQFVVPTITFDPQPICYNTTASFATPAAATGSDGNYIYQWQISTDNTQWTNLTIAPTNTPQGITTPALTLPTYYVRYTVTAGEGPLSSNVVTINVTPQIVSGTLNCTTLNINAGVIPAPITSTAAQYGCGDKYYRWQYSTGGAYSDIQGATNATLTFTSGVNITTSYILYTRDNTGEVASKPITITVSSPPCISYTGNQGQVFTYNVKITPLSINTNSNCGSVPATTYAM